MHKEVKEIVAYAESLGYEIRGHTGGSHPKVYRSDGTFVTSLPHSPGRGRWKQNVMALLKRRASVTHGVSGRS